MTTFYFILGMVVVLVVAGVIAMFTVIKTINSLKEQTKNYDIQFYDIHRKIDDENREQKRDCGDQFKDIYQEIGEINQKAEQEFQEVYRQLDSRLDKLETRLTTKQVIKG